MITLLFKGLCVGFFYPFLSKSAMAMFASCMIRKNAKIRWLVSCGVALAESLHAFLASFILFVLPFFVNMDRSLSIFLASTVLFLMAVRVYRSPNRPPSLDQTEKFRFKSVRSYFPNGPLNLIQILVYIAIFICLKMCFESFMGILMVVLGVFVGSFLCWILYSICMEKRQKEGFTKKSYRLNEWSPLVLILFSFLGVFQLLL